MMFVESRTDIYRRLVLLPSVGLVVVEFGEQLVKHTALSGHAHSLLLGVELATKVAPAAAFSKRREHLTSGSRWWLGTEEGEVLAWHVVAKSVVDVHVVVKVGRESWVGNLSAWRNLLLGNQDTIVGRRVSVEVASGRLDGRFGSCGWVEVEVVEVEVRAKREVIRRDVIECVVVKHHARIRGAGRTSILAERRSQRERVDVIEVKVHIEVTGEIG